MNRHDPLKCCIEDGVLIMQIGVEALAHAAKLNPDLTQYDEKTGQWVEPEITDVGKFAQAVLQQVLAEDDDGTTPVHRALDTAAMDAIECGAEGIKLPSEPRTPIGAK